MEPSPGTSPCQELSKDTKTEAHAPLLVKSFPKTQRTKPMHLSLSRAFQRHKEHDLKHPSSVDLITTKQNKLPSFIDRCCNCNE